MAALSHVAIDGPAGSGKTTVARALARVLGLLYLDTGAMYRAVALASLRAGIDPADEAAVVRLATATPVRVVRDVAATQGFRVWSGDVEFGDELYANDVSTVVSVVAAYPRIRSALVERQRAIAAEDAVIMAGRDIGTVVLPDAPHKIFLTASVDARVTRRAAELARRGFVVSETDLRRELIERDRLDATRAVAPLRPAAGAVEIDSTGATVDDVVARIAALVRSGHERVNPTVYALCRFGSWVVLRLVWRMRIVGRERIPASGPLIVACNHASYLDPPALGAAATRPITYMAKHTLFALPVLGPLITALGAFPVDRTRGDVAAIKAATAALQGGAALGIFPEGTRNKTGDVAPQLGVALLASRSGATVLPAYVSGTTHAHRLHRISVVFGEPLRFAPSEKARREDLAKWTRELMERIYALREMT